MTTTREELERRYMAAAHAVQAGVQMEMNDKPPRDSASAVSPKMLRTGLNLAMVGHGALIRVLIAKGICTEEEYFEELVKGVEAEKAAYEERLSARFGGRTKINLV
jgi:transcription termination factor NusB